MESQNYRTDGRDEKSQVWRMGPDGVEEFILHRNEVTGQVRRMTREAVQELVDTQHFRLLHQYRQKALTDAGEAERLLMSILSLGTLRGDVTSAEALRREMAPELERREYLAKVG